MSVIRTYRGINFDLLEPTVDMIDIRDIAHGLANKCRFSGFTREYYSVAQHSIHVSQRCLEYPMHGLLHDAAEAYLTDLPTPVKKLCPKFKGAEEAILALILVKYTQGWNWASKMPDEVHEADRRMLSTEAFQLINGDHEYWPSFNATAYEMTLDPLCPRVAEQLFLTTFERLGGTL